MSFNMPEEDENVPAVDLSGPGASSSTKTPQLVDSPLESLLTQFVTELESRWTRPSSTVIVECGQREVLISKAYLQGKAMINLYQDLTEIFDLGVPKKKCITVWDSDKRQNVRYRRMSIRATLSRGDGVFREVPYLDDSWPGIVADIERVKIVPLDF